MKLKFHTLDVFTKEPFTGNPLAVVLGADGLSDRAMQNIAREFNLSETIFVHSPVDSANSAKVRIFMPKGELPFAGHPTLGCAVLLACLKQKDGCSFETVIRLEEKAGLVPVKVSRIGPVAYGMFAAPTLPKVAGKAPPAAEIARAVGLEAGEIGFGTHLPGLISASSRLLFVPVKDLNALARARVKEPTWSEVLKEADTFTAYIYTARAHSGSPSFRARLFAPGEGIPEDPATGLAAAALPGQILAHETLATGTHRWLIEQGVEMGRPSGIDLEVDITSGTISAVRVGGSAVRVTEGTIEV